MNRCAKRFWLFCGSLAVSLTLRAESPGLHGVVMAVCWSLAARLRRPKKKAARRPAATPRPSPASRQS